jgi:ubiquinone/menaquinone biosynthesis C-methylase UbiE
MNQAHLELCSSKEWAEAIETLVIPWVMEGGVNLGENLLEVGPGPGATTNVLRTKVPRLTAVELDPELAAKLVERFTGTNVEVHEADATAMPFESGRFNSAASFTMLHHVPTTEMQDELFAEVARVLQPGGVFFGGDSLDSPAFRDLHEGDVCNPLDPVTLTDRLRSAGFADVEVVTHSAQPALRFRARTN